jgi:hypothetical protein
MIAPDQLAIEARALNLGTRDYLAELLSRIVDSLGTDKLADANLRGDSAAPLAMALRGRPFLFVSGYERVYLPEAFLDVPLLSKPFEPRELISAVTQLLSTARTIEDRSRSRPESY